MYRGLMAEQTAELTLPDLRDVLMQEPGERAADGVLLVHALALELEFMHSFDHPIPEGTKPWGAPLHRERIKELIEQNLTVVPGADVTLQTYGGCARLEFTLRVDCLEYRVFVTPKLTQPGFKIVAGRWGEPDQKKFRLLEATFTRFLLRRVAYVPRNYKIVTSEVMLKEGAPDVHS